MYLVSNLLNRFKKFKLKRKNGVFLLRLQVEFWILVILI